MTETAYKIESNDTEIKKYNNLENKWCLWAHLPHDTDWSLESYKIIDDNIDTVEKTIAITEILPEKLIKNCMLFLMKKGIQPIWEDKQNQSGGCFSYKISNKYVKDIWTKLTYCLLGESLTNDINLHDIINGITISPKKNFCVIKIWTNTCEYKNADIITKIDDQIIPDGCLFKKHIN
tara:strand:- start:294 stop:827 length:534 start_codon:yes stop_codon:yes gene_type:complete